MLSKIKESKDFIYPFLDGEYSIGIILGTGLGELGKSIKIKQAIPLRGNPQLSGIDSRRASR